MPKLKTSSNSLNKNEVQESIRDISYALALQIDRLRELRSRLPRYKRVIVGDCYVEYILRSIKNAREDLVLLSDKVKEFSPRIHD